MSKIEDIIYLNVDFISMMYEEKTGNPPDTQLTRGEGKGAKAGIPWLSTNISSTETKSFKLSTIQMWKKINDKLSYPEFDVERIQENQKTSIVWIEGIFTIGRWDTTKRKTTLSFAENVPREERTKPTTETSEIVEGNEYFYIKDECKNVNFPLLVNSEYFYSGIEQLPSIDSIYQRNISFPVKALVKVLYRPLSKEDRDYNFEGQTEHEFISYPYIILEQVKE
ncbi:hypothetical protein PN36_14640 [Candidatus Thiomargarita nelsonii]|uniref:Uncharacterized protein n=1 Tax=Candidatus Thiomargarita nelsonii TaxID=1003181 RepID=A0A0A6RTG5_9GAMM|nr:hypothetical protein PN36_14640 [Candidatus Thiomargarita nelsonii]